MSAYVYILESIRDGSYYIGSTRDLNKRIEEHNSGKSKYTSSRTPWKIVYYEELLNISQAQCREAFFKKQRNRKFYQKLIDKFNQG